MSSRWIAALLTAALCLAQQPPKPLAQQAKPKDPWGPADMMPPAALAKILNTPKAKEPYILAVAYKELYVNKHIRHAVFIGPTKAGDVLQSLSRMVAGLPKDADIVIYCGCCPLDHCPNVRPAFNALRGLGYTKVRLLKLVGDLATDWTAKGYPVDTGLQDSDVRIAK